ncbi:IS66 family insertion sequence element accessory protein TnpB [Caldifermentibacillus hisashii]|uniref:IS66 family insertion sequence element accessory protein TnpA n=1 Tax=Caldifermentibacillus hisashii TaxID=996558 RepID=UPI003135F7D2
MNDADKRIEWKARYDAWKTSGLSAAEWSRSQGIKTHQLYYWIRKFREDEVFQNEPQTKWLTVNVQDIPSRHMDQESVLIHFETLSVEVRPGTNLNLLSDVVRVIQNQ